MWKDHHCILREYHCESSSIILTGEQEFALYGGSRREGVCCLRHASLFALETDCGLPRHALPSNCLVDFLSCCLVNRCSEMDF